MTSQRFAQSGAGMSRRLILTGMAASAGGLAAAGLAGCSQPTHTAASSGPTRAGSPTAPAHSDKPAREPSDAFTPNATMPPEQIASLEPPLSASPTPVRTRPVYRVHDLRPSAPADAVALTIDDGPDPHWTPQVLDLLARYHVRATFSLVGVEVHAHRDLVRRIVAEGHTVANHTMTHPQPFTRRTLARIDREISRAQSVLVDAIGAPPRLFRSPGGIGHQLCWPPPPATA